MITTLELRAAPVGRPDRRVASPIHARIADSSVALSYTISFCAGECNETSLIGSVHFVDVRFNLYPEN